MFLFIILADKGVNIFSSCHFEFPTYDRSYSTGQGTSAMVLPTTFGCALQLYIQEHRNDHQFSLWTQLTHYELELRHNTTYYLPLHKSLSSSAGHDDASGPLVSISTLNLCPKVLKTPGHASFFFFF